MPRSRTDFRETKGYKRAVDAFGKSNVEQVLDEIAKFEAAWKASSTDKDIPLRFKPEKAKLDGLAGAYVLREIHVRSNYRAAFMLLGGHDIAYWVHAWKKDSDYPEQIKLAISRARRLWEQLQGRL